MTAKEKAQDLVNKFRLSAILTDSYVKAIAKTAVDEILTIGCIEVPYWQEVKKEIELL